MSDTPLNIAVNGAVGRMGQRIVALTIADKDLKLAAALEHATNPRIGEDAGEVCGAGTCGVAVTSQLDDRVDVVIDFSLPEALDSVLAPCEERRIPLVIATTGYTDEQRERIASAAQSTPVVMAPSMSMAVNLVMKLVEDAARVLRDNADGVDVEIIERHHRFKEDAPSGTALHFGKIIAEQMGQENHVHGREGRPGQRPHNEIGYHALRTGDNVGEHTIVFGMLGETIDLTVRGHTRDSYAYGALAAAKYVVTQGAGLYSMKDVLGL
ncbi:MAG: 4-hydroxy-tetrahydrodipicolinate reductase [Fuerstiella sp.]|nr:4-hydroxy-tetrahydrodipicolinate reductase [Fuerstiella sp.]MCP4859090.1 4-hydroxy-tetrahydrodipicolinate reductase [Fuerstiella sp.]